ncbi:MAG: DnaD domain protein [Lachnospiraceae bacterium]|nr:DnaD domain protein [Lachnospiraceae bacterium]
MSSLVVSCSHSGYTNISDAFIDEILGELNEAQVKIYLYLLRSVQGNIEISLNSIEDKFNYSERDVIRAFKYLEKNRLITIDTDEDKNLKGLSLLEVEKKQRLKVAACSDVKDSVCVKPSELPVKTSYSAAQLQSFKDRPEISELIYVSETYLGRMLNESDISSILYMNNDLGFSSELIEYLIEYCANNKKKKMAYIEKVAITWAKEGISNVEEAKKFTFANQSEAVEVLKAFGIEKRKPVDMEISYVNKWVKDLGFSMDIISLACERTIMNIQKPSFEYADAILSNWKKENVTCILDIEKLDDLRRADQKQKEASDKGKAAGGRKRSSGSKSRGSDIDYDKLAQELMGRGSGE